MLKIALESLGCSKNLIDTEMAIGLFKNNKFEIVNDVFHPALKTHRLSL